VGGYRRRRRFRLSPLPFVVSIQRLLLFSSFHPDTPAPPPAPDSTTADEGLREGWLPPGTRVVGVGGGEVEVRVPAAPLPVRQSGASVDPNSSFSTSTSAAGHSGMSGRRRGEETPYTYHTPLDPRLPNAAKEHPAHDREGCLGCVRVRERERWERGRALLGAHECRDSGSEEESEAEGEGKDDAEMEGGGSSGSQAHTRSSGSFAARASTSEERSASPSSASAASASRGYSPSSSPRSQAPSQHSSPSQDSTAAPWPEWSAPAWAAHRFDEDEGWEGACDGVQDVVFTGEVSRFSAITSHSFFCQFFFFHPALISLHSSLHLSFVTYSLLSFPLSPPVAALCVPTLADAYLVLIWQLCLKRPP
jgi:hypothetical protein